MAFSKGQCGKRTVPAAIRATILQDQLHVTDRAAFAEATDLIALFGEHARLEAALRADRSRSLGNVIHFCHWRKIERTIEMLNTRDVTGSIH